MGRFAWTGTRHDILLYFAIDAYDAFLPALSSSANCPIRGTYRDGNHDKHGAARHVHYAGNALNRFAQTESACLHPGSGERPTFNTLPACQPGRTYLPRTGGEPGHTTLTPA